MLRRRLFSKAPTKDDHFPPAAVHLSNLPWRRALIFLGFFCIFVIVAWNRGKGDVAVVDFDLKKGEGERVLILVPLKNALEHIWHHFTLLSSLTYPAHLISIAFLVSDSTDRTFERTRELAEHHQYRERKGWESVKVYKKNFMGLTREGEEEVRSLASLIQDAWDKWGWEGSEQLKKMYPTLFHATDVPGAYRTEPDPNLMRELLSNAPGKLRHSLVLQPARRRLLAKSRTWLLSSALREHHDWVLWLDVDVIQFREGMIQDLIRFAKEGGADVVAPNCMWRTYNEMGGYDLNNWKETEESLALQANMSSDDILIEGYASHPTHRNHMIHHPLSLDPDPTSSLLIDLDGVGGCTLLVKADMHRQGAIFPAWPVHSQLETEGFARIVKQLGGKIRGVPRYHVYHGLYG
ncbi:glycosyltransferase family 62 protein [Atractiella rhizophila]|nr:glycosyltransferase family 62 protein [Atractiella rhizophila]